MILKNDYTSDENVKKLYKITAAYMRPPIATIQTVMRKQLKSYDNVQNNIRKKLIHQIPQIHEILVKEYADALLSSGYGFKRSQLKKMDTIDMSGINDKPGNIIYPNVRKEHASEYENEDTDMFYSIIPCFEEGVIHVCRDQYIYFKIKDLNLDEKAMDIHIHYHIKDGNVWIPGISADIAYKHAKIPENDAGNQNGVSFVFENETDYTKLFSMIPYETMGWCVQQKTVWENATMKIAKKQDEDIKKEGILMPEILSLIFTNQIMYANFCLKHDKPKLIKLPDDEKTKMAPDPGKTKEKPDKTEKPESAKQMRTRIVGPIRIRSIKVPKAASPKNPPRYSVAAWTVCGHTRRLKNGKLLYVKPKIHRRKCLQGKENNNMPIQSVIKIKP